MNPAKPVDPRIESYLSRLTSPLERTLDDANLEEFRSSALFHLECLVEEFADSEDSVAEALREYGAPDVTALAILDEWARGRDAQTFARGSSGAAWWSFSLFGLAAAVTSIAVVATQMWPGGAFLRPVAMALLWLGPVAAGAGVGYLVPTGNLRAFGLALLPILLQSWLVGYLMHPYEPGLLLGQIQTLGWIPLGALSLSVTAWFRRNRPSRYRLLPPKEIHS